MQLAFKRISQDYIATMERDLAKMKEAFCPEEFTGKFHVRRSRTSRMGILGRRARN